MKIKFLYIIIFHSLIGYSTNYSTYYEHISIAKRHIIDHELEKATIQYQSTFELYDFVFARDAYHALQIACLINDHHKTEYFFKRCLKQGVKFELLASEDMLSDFKKNDKWNNILEQKDSLRHLYLDRINLKIRDEIVEMFTQDQSIRSLVYKNRYNPFRFFKLNNQWKALNKVQVERIIEITRQFGFPGEQLIGIDDKELHPKLRNTRMSAGMPIVIFIHHYSQPNKSFNDILQPEINTGNVYNGHFAVICDFQNKYGKSKNNEILNYSNRFLTTTNISQLNKRRQRIGLLTIEEEDILTDLKIIRTFWKYLY